MPPPLPTTTSESFLSGACGLRDHHQHGRRPSSSGGGNSYFGGGGEAYADPRCEMKKRQQQEIVVSGLNINASDISSEEEEPEETTDDLEAVVEKSSSVEHILFQDEALINLIGPAVKKVGGGGAVSLSAFQVGSRIPLLHHSYLINLSAANAKATLKIRMI